MELSPCKSILVFVLVNPLSEYIPFAPAPVLVIVPPVRLSVEFHFAFIPRPLLPKVIRPALFIVVFCPYTAIPPLFAPKSI